LPGLGSIHAEDEAAVADALALMKHGIELAHAIDLASWPAGAVFLLVRPVIGEAREASGSGGVAELR